MSEREVTVLTNVALITCIVQRGMAEEIITAAREAGAQGATVHYAKGMGIRERLGILGVAVEVEKEVVNILVSTEQADKVFETIYLAGRLDTPGMGLVYTTLLDKAATSVPAEIIKKIAEKNNPSQK
jgi:nitrogen regulatory protein P-II 1